MDVSTSKQPTRRSNDKTIQVESESGSIDSNKPLSPKSTGVNDGANSEIASSKSSQQTTFNAPILSLHDPPPFFYHTNNTHHSFKLNSAPSVHNSYTTYSTTLSLILILHLLYLYQWNKRHSRKDVATSYDQLVNNRQYWRGLLAILSHPPIDGGERDVGLQIDYSSSGVSGERETNGTDGANEDFANTETNRRFLARWILYSRIRTIIQKASAPLRIVKRILHPLLFGHLSGLPLLIFVSHVLWQCRALEEFYDMHGGKLILGVEETEIVSKFSGMASHVVALDTSGEPTSKIDGDNNRSYIRVLITLSTTSILLELTLLRAILRRMDRLVDFTGYSTTPRTLLSHRAICSLTSLAAALLAVYDSIFPFSPPPVLPFVQVSVLNSSGFSLLFSVMILGILSHRIHPVTSVISGLLSGSLWAWGVTSFLGTRYWGNAMIGSLVGSMLLSLKSNQSCSMYLEMLLPCVDYVAWDGEGNIHDTNASHLSTRQNNSQFGSSRNETDEGDFEMGQTSYIESNDNVDFSTSQRPSSAERRPLLSHATDSTLSNESSVIRGRVPFINSMDSDLDDIGQTMNNAGSRFDGSLSRRTRGVL
eukprot:CCRYP_005466-RA/>CCRYP_005466-RA protein AED:0.00 eAED:0.00 QI:248/-1/1/1/-1/1/1/140/592